MELALSSIPQRIKRFLQALEFGIAANHARLNAFHPAPAHPKSTRPAPLHHIDLDRLGLALDADRLQGLHVKHAPYMAIGVVRNQNATHRRSALQAGGQVDRVAHGGELVRRANLA
jgi:hypothetical protein